MPELVDNELDAVSARSLISGGREFAAVASECSLSLDVRVLPGPLPRNEESGCCSERVNRDCPACNRVTEVSALSARKLVKTTGSMLEGDATEVVSRSLAGRQQRALLLLNTSQDITPSF